MDAILEAEDEAWQRPDAAAPPAPQRPSGVAPIGVTLRLGEAAAARLAAIPGALLVTDPALAEVLVTDAPPRPSDPPALVLAEGAAALRALRAGARAILPAGAGAADIAAVLPLVARGGLVALPGAVLDRLLGRGAASPGGPAGEAEGGGGGAALTPREREVLALLTAGASNKVIARRLGLSFHTAKAHVAAVLHKLGAGSRADAVARGARAGLVML